VKFLDQKLHAGSPGALSPVPQRPPSSGDLVLFRQHPAAPGRLVGYRVLTVKGRTAPVELTVVGVSAEGAAIVFRACPIAASTAVRTTSR